MNPIPLLIDFEEPEKKQDTTEYVPAYASNVVWRVFFYQGAIGMASLVDGEVRVPYNFLLYSWAGNVVSDFKTASSVLNFIDTMGHLPMNYEWR